VAGGGNVVTAHPLPLAFFWNRSYATSIHKASRPYGECGREGEYQVV
jgi:hypothetical protein